MDGAGGATRVIGSMFRFVIKAMVGAGLLGAAALGLGFLWFAAQVARTEPAALPPADGIVALTGGASRITDATQLLANGLGQRLLITGVHPATSRVELARALGETGGLINCCVDLDYDAVNTLGNAVETSRWVREHGFHSLIVVTSAYHMPRTLLELRRRLPQVALLPYPVVSEHVQLDHWWDHPPTLRLLVAEYAKYLLALTRGPTARQEVISPAILAPRAGIAGSLTP